MSEGALERWRRRGSLIAGPLMAILCWSLPLPDWCAAQHLPPLSPEGHRLIGVMVWVMCYWVGEALPLPATALLGAVLATLLGIAPAKEVLAPFAHPLIFLFLGSFILARAFQVHRLDRRLVLAVLSLRGVGNRPGRLLVALGAVAAFLSMWMSNTAVAAMLFPLGLGLVGMVEELWGETPSARRYGIALMLMVAYAASVGGLATPIGTPPNLITIGYLKELANIPLGFLSWMLITLPVTLAVFIVVSLTLRLLFPWAEGRLEGVEALLEQERSGLGPWTPGQRNTLLAFAVALTLWLALGLAEFASPQAVWAAFLKEHLSEGTVALLAALLLFLLPVDWRQGRFTLTWREAVEIDWGTLLLFGGGLALGDLLFKTGVASLLGQAILRGLGVRSAWGLTGLVTLFGTLFTEFTSNTAAANMLIPVVLATAREAGFDPLPAALGACLGINLAFVLPISTPPNAIVYGSGRVPLTAMAKAGLLLDLSCWLTVWGLLRLLDPTLGWSM